MALTSLVLSPQNAVVRTGELIRLETKIVGGPLSQSKIEWSINAVAVPDADNFGVNYRFTSETEGLYTIAVKVSYIEDSSVSTVPEVYYRSAIILVEDDDSKIPELPDNMTLGILGGLTTIRMDQFTDLRAYTFNAPDMSTSEFTWSTGEKTRSISFFPESVGQHSFRCDATVSRFGKSKTIANAMLITVTEGKFNFRSLAKCREDGSNIVTGSEVELEAGFLSRFGTDAAVLPPGTVISYYWEYGGKTYPTKTYTPESQEGDNIQIVPVLEGSNKAVFYGTVTAPNYEPIDIGSNVVWLTGSATPDTLPVVTITTSVGDTVPYGTSQVYTATVSGLPEGATSVKYSWAYDTIHPTNAVEGNKFTFETAILGFIPVYCVATYVVDSVTKTACSEVLFVNSVQGAYSMAPVVTTDLKNNLIATGTVINSSVELVGTPKAPTTSVEYRWNFNNDGEQGKGKTSRHVCSSTDQELYCDVYVTYKTGEFEMIRSNVIKLTQMAENPFIPIVDGPLSVPSGNNYTLKSTYQQLGSGTVKSILWSDGQTIVNIAKSSVQATVPSATQFYFDSTIEDPAWPTTTKRSATHVVKLLARFIGYQVDLSTIENTTELDFDNPFYLLANIANLPEGSKVAYTWSNGTESFEPDDEDDRSQLEYKPPKPGTYSFSCVATVTNPDYVTNLVSSPTKVNLISRRIIVPVEMSEIEIVGGTTPTKPNQEYISTYTHICHLDDVEIDTTWSDGIKTVSNTQTSKVGENNYSVTATFSHENYDPVSLTRTMSFMVADDVDPDDDDTLTRYIHPLPWRESSFVWCGYWVLDEIQQAVQDGIDWKNPDATDLKYKLELRTLAKMLRKYDHMEVMESRHGYVKTNADFEIGIFY